MTTMTKQGFVVTLFLVVFDLVIIFYDLSLLMECLGF